MKKSQNKERKKKKIDRNREKASETSKGSDMVAENTHAPQRKIPNTGSAAGVLAGGGGY